MSVSCIGWGVGAVMERGRGGGVKAGMGVGGRAFHRILFTPMLVPL